MRGFKELTTLKQLGMPIFAVFRPIEYRPALERPCAKQSYDSVVVKHIIMACYARNREIRSDESAGGGYPK